MYLAFAFGAAPGSSPNLKWWFGQAAITPATLRERLTAGLPIRSFDPHSAPEPAAERERLYDFLHAAEAAGQQLIAYAIPEGATLDDLDNALEQISLEHVFNSLRSMEIIEYQVAKHDRGDQPDYDPEGYANELARQRLKRYGAL